MAFFHIDKAKLTSEVFWLLNFNTSPMQKENKRVVNAPPSFNGK
jgi:hypothetical protein